MHNDSLDSPNARDNLGLESEWWIYFSLGAAKHRKFDPIQDHLKTNPTIIHRNVVIFRELSCKAMHGNGEKQPNSIRTTSKKLYRA